MESHEITGTLAEVKGKAEKQYGQLSDNLRNAKEEIEGRTTLSPMSSKSQWETVTEWIRENPGSATGVALVVGLGLGALMMGLAQD